MKPWFPTTLASLACVATLTAPPALALEAMAVRPESSVLRVGYSPVLGQAAPAAKAQRLDATTAAVLTFGPPLGILLVGGMVLPPLLGSSSTASIAAMSGLSVAAAAGSSAGYLYVGEPGRGALLAAGNLALLGVTLVGTKVVWDYNPILGLGMVMFAAPVFTLGLAGLNGLAAYDLYNLVKAKNQQLQAPAEN